MSGTVVLLVCALSALEGAASQRLSASNVTSFAVGAADWWVPKQQQTRGVDWRTVALGYVYLQIGYKMLWVDVDVFFECTNEHGAGDPSMHGAAICCLGHFLSLFAALKHYDWDFQRMWLDITRIPMWKVVLAGANLCAQNLTLVAALAALGGITGGAMFSQTIVFIALFEYLSGQRAFVSLELVGFLTISLSAVAAAVLKARSADGSSAGGNVTVGAAIMCVVWVQYACNPIVYGYLTRLGDGGEPVSSDGYMFYCSLFSNSVSWLGLAVYNLAGWESTAVVFAAISSTSRCAMSAIYLCASEYFIVTAGLYFKSTIGGASGESLKQVAKFFLLFYKAWLVDQVSMPETSALLTSALNVAGTALVFNANAR